ncbi:hypothetical protein [Clavibacter zhangzhiyongii]|uniref:Uncharacterized protein n=1 Tax=Clavibacter zhangzhiyongii TaxID=2768071 RepID=A0A7L7Z3Q2_9MICO|nr:hypothetical protein [Clavibacter zhangzhiyongii]QOD44342.1 hypothetical protein H9X71_03040 [Clavibacter zhangzhiyongii]
MSGRRGTTALLAVAALVVVGGAVGVVVALAQPLQVGSFAFVGGGGSLTFGPGALLVSTGALVAAGVLALGLVALAFGAGIRVGGRRDADGGGAGERDPRGPDPDAQDPR